jgi:hypothetical protein
MSAESNTTAKECFTPEVVQILRGNVIGAYAMDDYAEALLHYLLHEIERVFGNVNQREWDREEDPSIPGIEFHPYYWDECICGYEERASEWSETHSHAADCYYTEYRALEGDDDEYRPVPNTVARSLCKKHGIPWNKGIGSAVHCTCTHEAEWRAWQSENDHAATCPIGQPNLAFGGVEIRWYKHPHRGLSVNRAMDEHAWRLWLDAALTAVRGADVDWLGRL